MLRGTGAKFLLSFLQFSVLHPFRGMFMAKARKSVLQLVRQPRSLVCFMACSLFLFAGCHTSEDAVWAATQMSVTAKCLSDYYTALNMILADTDQIYILNEQLFSKPYTPENRELLKNNRAELEKRAVLAADFSTRSEERRVGKEC